MAGVPDRDPVPDHAGATEKASPLQGLLAETVADRVHRRFQALAAGSRRIGEEVHLSRISVAEPADPDAQGPDLTAAFANGQQLQRGPIDLLPGGDRDGQFGLLREMTRLGTVDDADRYDRAPAKRGPHYPPAHVRQAHQEFLELGLGAGRPSEDVGMAVALAGGRFEASDLEAAQLPAPASGNR